LEERERKRRDVFMEARNEVAGKAGKVWEGAPEGE
jgi:hypothetical protein